MKSQVSFLLKNLEKDLPTHKKINQVAGKITLTEKIICDIAYEFQEAVIEVLAKKLIKS